uniref:Uncharacterized protein n=1 Tax=Oryza brachyantha TaxID=4533 RepID=J3MUV3_ORYBR
MESTVLSLGKFVLGGALGYAQSAVAEEVALQLGIQRDHAFVRDELAMMRSFLMVAHEEEREHNKVVRTWVQQLRDLAYDVEDCLQDMAVRSSRWRKCCSPRALLERRRVAKKMKELRAKVEDVSQRNMRYRLIRASGSGSAAGRQHLAGTTPMPAASVDEARWQQEKASADLVRLISRKDDELRVIAVWGPSDALDKTSIVRRAYGDLKTSGKFDCYACVSLMSHFNQKEFLLSIVSQFIENHIEAAMERQEKQAPPTDVLRNMVMAKEDDIYLVDAFLGYVEEKNYLIVLNDVSTIEEWGRIKPYFPNNKKGSRVIVTTKQVGVATLCVGPESAAPELMHISSDRTLHVFYEKDLPSKLPLWRRFSTGVACIFISNRKTIDKFPKFAFSSFQNPNSQPLAEPNHGKDLLHSGYRSAATFSTLRLAVLRGTKFYTKFLNNSWYLLKDCKITHKTNILLYSVPLSLSTRDGNKDIPIGYGQNVLIPGAQDGTDPTKHGSSSKKEDGAAALNEFELIGRVDEKNDITNLVSKKDIKGRHVISVWGMGGVGKTTLVREVYQSPELSGMFDKRAWVTIMRPFNCSHHLKSLAVQFGDGNKADNLTVLLQGKKYLIVLDDVWFISEWNEIVPHLPETAGSCVIVTTRQQSIAKHCSNKESDDIHILRMLESNHARELFTRKVFKEDNWEEKYPELVGQVEPIIKKCNGLPLAIVTIGGFLANQPKSVLTWRKLNEHISAELEMNPELDTIRTVLLKSYDGLPYHLKSCFLYLCIFPEDHKVSRKRLMQRWIAEGYACEARGKSSIEIAHDNFIELISRSMVLPAAQNSIKLGRGIDYCQLHDLMREISITKSIEENLVLRLEDGCSSNSHGATRHLAISSNWKGDEHEFQSIVDLSRVRSITVFGRWKPFFISEKMRMLRVLDLEDAHGLVEHHLEHIGKLIHLKYLSLSGYGNILHLPDSLGNLRQLETLDIRYTTIAILPRTIVKLRKLKYLHAGASGMSSSKSLAERSLRLLRNGSCLCGACCAPCLLEDLDWYEPYSAGGFSRRDACNYICCVQPHILSMDLDNYYPMLPRGIRKLKGLHTLQHVHLAWGNVATREIERLTQLRRLGVTGINKKNGPAFCSAISKLGRLESLSVLGSYELGLRGCLEYRGTSSTSPSPPENLQSLRLIGQLGKLPQWIGKLQNLMKLRLEETALEDADAAIQVLGALPSLAILRLQDSFKGGVRPNFRQPEATAILFPSLRVLDLYFVGSGSGLIKSVQFGGGAAPKLEVLLYLAHFCDIGLLSGLEELPSLKEFMLDNNEIYTDEFVEDVRKQLANHPNTNKPLLKRFFLLCLHSKRIKIQRFMVKGTVGKVLEWIGKLQNLVKLRLLETSLEDADATIKVLGVLPSLAILHLWGSFKGGVRLNFRQEEATAILFPSLRVLDLYFVPGSRSGLLESVQFGGGATPKLEQLRFTYKPDLCDIGLLSGLEELQSLEEFMLDNNEIYTDEFVEDVRKQLANHPNTNKPLLKRYDR